MPDYRITLTDHLPRSHADELAKRVFYVSSVIESFRLINDDRSVIGLDITTTTPIEPDDLARKLNLLVRKDVLPQRATTASIIWRSPHAAEPVTGMLDALEATGAVFRMGEGLYALDERTERLMNSLDRLLSAIAVADFGAVSFRYPTLISTAALKQGGYLDSFPQFLMAASRLHCDVDTYEEFSDGLASAVDLAAYLDGLSEHLGYCLPPTMCFHTYHQQRERPLPGHDLTVTARGKSFRFESKYHRGLERLWDFTIREVVFLGDRHTVARRRQRFLEQACALVTDLGLPGHVEVANDPFFCNDQTADRIRAQRFSELKYELRLPVGEGRTVSAGSFNVHGTAFSVPYGITLPDGETAYTACVGFGLERLTYAFLCRHGLDDQHWPDSVRAVFEGMVSVP